MYSFTITKEEQTQQLAQALAAILQGGEFISLRGELGAGKSSFARATIRALARNERLEVPSPSFTIIQPYFSFSSLPIYHCDLYRISDQSEIFELGLEPIMAKAPRAKAPIFEESEAIYLVEWPQRAQGVLRKPELDLHFTFAQGEKKLDEESRLIHASGCAELLEGLKNYA